MCANFSSIWIVISYSKKKEHFQLDYDLLIGSKHVATLNTYILSCADLFR